MHLVSGGKFLEFDVSLTNTVINYIGYGNNTQKKVFLNAIKIFLNQE